MPKEEENQISKPERPSALLSKVNERLNGLEKNIAILAEPVAKRNDPNRSFWERLADNIENSIPSRIIIGLGALLALLSLAGIFATAWGVRLQYLSMEEERLARAWQALATPGLGNGGKVDAIQYIHSRKETLSGINIGGTSRATGPFLSSLHLSNASIWDGNWDYAFFENSRISNTNIGRLSLNFSEIHGNWDNVSMVWSDVSNSAFYLKSESDISIDTSLFDFSSFFIETGKEILGTVKINDDTERYTTSSGKIVLGGPEEEKQSKIDAGQVVSFSNVSLRCALIPLEHAVNYSFKTSNLSGAYIGSPFYFQEIPEEQFAKLPESEWKKFEGAWYFSDNPPKGVPPEFLKKHFRSVDRDSLSRQCKRFEPRAKSKNPFSLLDGVDGIETACVSLARHPDKCQTRYPSRQIFTLESSENEEFQLKEQ